MQVVKVRTFSGVVCEQEVFPMNERGADRGTVEPRLRFQSEEERAQHRDMISRRRHARQVNENFSAGDLYCTFTFDNENEVHSFDEARRVRDNFVRRLKYRYPTAVIFIYMGRGKNTSRIHFHALIKGVEPDYIVRQWRYGTVLRIDPLREHNYYDGVDHGQDYTGLANYLFDHWTPEQGGHRWKMTRNARKPEREAPTVVRREYSEDKPPRPPKGYKLVETRSTKYGYFYFKYVIEPPKRERKKAAISS